MFFEKQNQSFPPLEEREGGSNPLKYTDPSGELYYLKQATKGVVDSRASIDYSNRIGIGNPGKYGDVTGGGGRSYVGAPGYGENGTGENGVYFDWYSGTYRSTDLGNNELYWQYAYNIASHDAIELVYRGRATNMGDGSYASNPLGNAAVYVWTPITNVYGNPQGQGGMPGWASDVNIGINAFGVANSAKTELIDYAVRSNYKSARTWSEFNNLRSSQQAWRTTNTLGKTGANYLKYAKGLGYVGAGLTTTYSAANAGMYYYNGGTDWQVGTKATLDVIMTGVGFLGPIGFGISASYFILDTTTGGFGGFGQIKP